MAQRSVLNVPSREPRTSWSDYVTQLAWECFWHPPWRAGGSVYVREVLSVWRNWKINGWMSAIHVMEIRTHNLLNFFIVYWVIWKPCAHVYVYLYIDIKLFCSTWDWGKVSLSPFWVSSVCRWRRANFLMFWLECCCESSLYVVKSPKPEISLHCCRVASQTEHLNG